MHELKKDVFPEPLVPQIKNVLVPSTIKLIRPAAKEFIMRFLINKGRVQGLSLCLLNEYARPLGDKGSVNTEILADATGRSSSVSRIALTGPTWF